MTSTNWNQVGANNIVLLPSGLVPGDNTQNSRVLYKSHNLYRKHIPYDGLIYIQMPPSTSWSQS